MVKVAYLVEYECHARKHTILRTTENTKEGVCVCVCVCVCVYENSICVEKIYGTGRGKLKSKYLLLVIQ